MLVWICSSTLLRASICHNPNGARLRWRNDTVMKLNRKINGTIGYLVGYGSGCTALGWTLGNESFWLWALALILTMICGAIVTNRIMEITQ